MPSTQPLCEGSMRWQEREWLLAQPAEWWSDVFDRIACGVSPRDIAKEYCLRYAILARVIGESDDRQKEYEDALKIASDGYAHEVVAIADDGSNDTYVDDEGRRKVDTDVIARSKLRIETRLKLAGKWHRGRYGDTVTIENVKRVVLDLKFGAQKKVEGDVVDAVLVEPEKISAPVENSEPVPVIERALERV